MMFGKGGLEMEWAINADRMLVALCIAATRHIKIGPGIAVKEGSVLKSAGLFFHKKGHPAAEI